MRKVILFAGASVALTAAMAMPALAGNYNNYCKNGDAYVQDADNNLGGVHNATQDIYQGQGGVQYWEGHDVYKTVYVPGHYVGNYPYGYYVPPHHEQVVDHTVYSTIQKQTAANKKYQGNGGHQVIKQGQLGFFGSECGPTQNQNALNFSKKGSNNTQKIKQFQFGVIWDAFGTAQDQDAKNSVEKGSNNTQKIKQKQSIFAWATDGTVQSQDADNSVYKGHDNDQSIKQSQSLSVGYAENDHGATQDQDANNSVVKGHDNDQSIKQSQSLDAGSTSGTVQSQDADNSVYEGSNNEQSITQSQHSVLIGGPGSPS